MMNICPECGQRPCYGPKAKSCKVCLPGIKKRQAARWKAEHLDVVREKDRDRYRRKTGGRDPGKTHAKAQVSAGILPIVIQRILPGQMEAAIQAMLDRREAEYAERVREDAHEAVARTRVRQEGLRRLSELREASGREAQSGP